MLILAALPLSLAAGSVTAAPQASAQVRCPNSPTFHMARPGKVAEFRKLIDLPEGRTYAAVVRSDARGCIVPVLYSETRPKAPPALRH